MAQPRTLFEKVWDDHVVRRGEGTPDLLFVDLHLVHEVTSPQAFQALDLAGRSVRRPDLTLATVDHGVPTAARALGIADPLSKKQIDALVDNCERHGVTFYGLDDVRQGIAEIEGASGRSSAHVERRGAIAEALASAGASDVVLIAGKGHESTQTTAGRSEPFDDRVVAAAELKRLGWNGEPSA